MNKTTNLYAVIVIGFLSFILLTIFENNQQMSQIFNSFNSDNFKEVLASTKEEEEEEEEKDEEDSVKQKICNKLFESETCEKMKEDKPVEKKELTEEEIKAEALVNRYLEPIETEQKSIDNSVDSETEIVSNNSGSSNINSNSNSSSTILSNEIASKDVTDTNQQINSGQLSTQINPSSLNNTNLSTNAQNLNNLNQFQLVDLIASTISNANIIDKNKVTQSLNDFIEPTKANGGNVIEYLKQLYAIIVKDPSGSSANKIINLAQTK